MNLKCVQGVIINNFAVPKKFITEEVAMQTFKKDLVAYGHFWMQQYIDAQGMPVQEEKCPLVSFWGLIEIRESMPVLSFLVHVILSLSPSSADTERFFPDSGLSLSDRHQSFDAQRTEDLVVVKEK